jgi:hypothetical protein
VAGQQNLGSKRSSRSIGYKIFGNGAQAINKLEALACFVFRETFWEESRD